jgi:hypothetical protein
MVYDIDINELNIITFRNLNVLDEIWFKKMFFAFLNNKCIIISIFGKKNNYHIKEEEIL